MPLTPSDAILERLVRAGGFLPPEAVEEARRRTEAEGVEFREALAAAGLAPGILGSLEAAARGASSSTQGRAPSSAPTLAGPRAPSGSDVTMIAPGTPSPPGAGDAATRRREASSHDATVVSPSGIVVPRRAAGRLTHLGKYEILDEIGRGGMGVVYKARHPGLDRLVAIKTLLAPGSPEHVERFLREARSAARMGKHPNLVQVHDVGEENGVYYFTMEYVEGRGFDREIHEEKPPARRVAEVVEQIARGLANAHAEGVVHRDLKPSNILIDATGRPLLTDFGLAKEVGAGSSVSVAGQILGTPAYMSPEAADGRLESVNERSDVYGLGTVLYEGFARRAPFEAPGNIELLRQVTGTEPVPPSRLAPDLPRDLEVICLKCLAKRPEDRYESAAALADDLRRWLDGEPILARPLPWSVRMARKARKNALVVSLAAAAAVLLAAGAGIGVRLVRERREQARERERAAAAASAAEARRLEERRLAEEKRRRVEERVGRGRGILERAEKAMRPDVVALSGQGADAAQFDAALAEFDAALAEDPAGAEALRLRARAFRLSRRPREALAEAERALAARPGDPEALREKALADLDLLRTAMGHLSISIVPGLASLGSQRTRRVYVRTDPAAGAIRETVRADIEALTATGVSEAWAAYFRGILLAWDAQNNDEAALRELDAAIAADPTLVEAYRDRAPLLSRLGRPEALQAYRDLARAQPFDAEIQAELALIEDTREGTMRAINAAVKLAPQSAWVWARRGIIHLWYDESLDAEDDYRAALELDPANSAALYGLFSIREMRGDAPAADRLLADWQKLAPPDPLLWWEAGAYYRVTARHDLALPCFEQALQLDPGYPLYLWARGRSRVLVGRYQDGVKDMFDAVGAGDLEANTRKMYDALRARLEEQVEGMQKPEEMAKFAESLVAFLKLAQGMSSDAARKQQYEASIDNLLIIASELYEQAEKLDKARDLYLTVRMSQGSWGREYTLARIAARAYDKPRAFEHLRSAKALGMTSLGSVRVDPGFFRLRDCDEWPAYVKEHEGG